MGQKVTVEYIESYTTTPVTVYGEVDADDLVTIPEIRYPMLRKCLKEIPSTVLLDLCIRQFSDKPELVTFLETTKAKLVSGELEDIRTM